MALKLSRSDKALIYEMYPTSWPGGFKQMTRWIPQVASLFGSKKLSEEDYKKNLLGKSFDQPSFMEEKNNYAKYYIWLAPFFKSPWHDGGYDISDYKSVDPRFGTIEDFKCFIKVAKSYNIEVLLDLVPNHTSTAHPWYKKALKGDPDYLGYYINGPFDLGWKSIWDNEQRKDGTYKPAPAFLPEKIPIRSNGIRRMFEEEDPKVEGHKNATRYFLHSFSHFQADLDLTDSRVINEFHKIIKFWKDLGVAGFRIDCAQFLSKDLACPSLLARPFTKTPGIEREIDQPGNLKILHELVDPFDDMFFIGECGGISNSMIKRYAGPNGPLSAVFDTNTENALEKPFLGYFGEHYSFNRWTSKNLQRSKARGYCACVESHDTPRFVSRQAKGYYPITPKMVADSLFGADPQCICIYQGQEFGQKSPFLSDEEAARDLETKSKLERITPKKKVQAEISSRTNVPVSRNVIEYYTKKSNILNHSRQNGRAPVTVAIEQIAAESIPEKLKKIPKDLPESEILAKKCELWNEEIDKLVQTREAIEKMLEENKNSLNESERSLVSDFLSDPEAITDESNIPTLRHLSRSVKRLQKEEEARVKSERKAIFFEYQSWIWSWKQRPWKRVTVRI